MAFGRPSRLRSQGVAPPLTPLSSAFLLWPSVCLANAAFKEAPHYAHHATSLVAYSIGLR